MIPVGRLALLLPLLLLFTAPLFCTSASSAGLEKQPHIVFILADDLGFNDVPWHNPAVLAPELLALAQSGVTLEQSYVQHICTPSRAALMTGRYPFHLARQHKHITPLQPNGLTLNYTLLPQLMRDQGYRTHLVGKWHLGFCAPEYLPQNRGFDSFLGFWNGYEDFFQHTRDALKNRTEAVGLDFWQEGESLSAWNGTYSTEIFAAETERLVGEVAENPDRPMFLYLALQSVHCPLQVPQRYQDLYPDVENINRRRFLGMVSAMDEAVGRVVKSLKDAGIYDNSVVIFSTDNGADVLQSGNNFPLRGNKKTIWEGGTRGPAFVHSPLLKKTNYTSHQLIHITDWLPTLLHLAGADPERAAGKADQLPLDGFNQWETISEDLVGPRQEMVYNIDVMTGLSAAIRVGEMKLIWGYAGLPSGWYPPPEGPGEESSSGACGLIDPDVPPELILADQHSTRLFNLTADPEERQDLSADMPELVQQLQDRISQHLQTLVPADLAKEDEAGLPQEGVYFTGWCQPK